MPTIPASTTMSPVQTAERPGYQLTQLRDRRRWRLNARSQAPSPPGTPDSTAIVAGCPAGMCDASDVRDRCAQTADEHRDASRHECEGMVAKMARPRCPNQVSAATNTNSTSAERNTCRRQRRHVVDDGRGTGRHADRDREHEVDDQRADRHERPPLPERPCPPPPPRHPPSGRPRHKLVVIR